jgi:hypothetical protein
MKIECRSGNEYDLKMKFSRYQELQKAVRDKSRGFRKEARLVQRAQEAEKANTGEVFDEAALEAAEAVVLTLQDEMEEVVLPFVKEALANANIVMDDIDEPEDVADMVQRLLGSAPQGAPNPLAVSPDSTPTG